MIKKIFGLGILLCPLFLHGAPARIVSLAPALTKIVTLLGAEAQLVGVTSYCTIPSTCTAETVATTIDVNMEKVLLLRPDLVLTSDLTSPENRRMLEKLKIKTLHFPYARSFDDLCRDVEKMGQAVGRPDRAQQITDSARRELARVRSRIPQQPRPPRIMAQIGTNPLWVVIPNTFLNDFITFAGGVNIAADMKSGIMTREAALARNPDVIFIMLMGSMNDDEKQQWEKYSALNAVKTKKIFLLDQEKTCSPTPEDFVETLEKMLSLIYFSPNP
ncbi:MAG: helical backbone metal receptor [Bacteroidales bacterium]|nr:helical backbone metal receptor [Bacteroidales bacterium]